jgi:hypothetical protein
MFLNFLKINNCHHEEGIDMTDEHIKIIEELKQNAVYNQMSYEIIPSIDIDEYYDIQKLQVEKYFFEKMTYLSTLSEPFKDKCFTEYVLNKNNKKYFTNIFNEIREDVEKI